MIPITPRMTRLFKASISGLSLTLMLHSGVGIMRTLMGRYDDIIPGGHTRAPALTQLYISLPMNPLPTMLCLTLVFAGIAWMSAQEPETNLVLLNRCVLAFVMTGIYACGIPYRCLCRELHWSGYDPGLEQYLWLLPSCLPLLIAYARHRRSIGESMRSES